MCWNGSRPSTSPVRAKDGSNKDAQLGFPARAGAITPPPSTQISKPLAKSTQAKLSSRTEHSLASPPATLKTGPPITSNGLYGEVPSLESVEKMNEEELRRLVSELLPALGEARVTAAHSKLQHNLLAIETEESAKRAEVEHEATRREVQVLQEGNPVHRISFSPRSPQASMQRNLHLALAHCRELQTENAILEKRLRSSKKIITQLDGQNADLKETIHLLRQRIKENRDHLNEMQSSGAISINGTPIVEYNTPLHKGTPRTPATHGGQLHEHNQTVGSQDPIDNLLLAGHYLNGEANSVPATPTPPRPRKIQLQHMRGAHSLSSLPQTPDRSRPVTADNAMITSSNRNMTDHRISFSAPSTQLAYHEESRAREDRDSTISVTDNEGDSFVDEDVPGSQASQLAASMLRRSLESPQNERSAAPSHTPDSSKLIQAKLFGHVKKPSLGRMEALPKRGGDISSHDEIVRSSKKARMADSGSARVGLGIKSWPSPGH